MTLQHIVLKEWETRLPSSGSELEGLSLGSEMVRGLAENLSQAGLIAVEELRSGLRIRAFSSVGTITLGDIRITVLPKLEHSTLLNLLRYAYGFRKLRLFEKTSQTTEQLGFEDLLVSQLNAEAAELLSRGLNRTYLRRSERLGTLRGRIDLRRFAEDGGLITATLPCIHYPRSEDSLPNQVLLAGLRVAGTIASDLHLRRASRRLAALLEESVTPIRLDVGFIDRVERGLNRLTKAYEPAIKIIRLLQESQGVNLGEAETDLRVPGFLFDMNRFFQSLLAQFLSQNLSDCRFSEEHRLTGLVRFMQGFNPGNRRAPELRPDFVLFQGSKVAAVLDAKYRDLWETRLPREMFYQLAIYAGAFPQRSATILFPTTSAAASESRIEVRDPVHPQQAVQVRLRPVHLGTLEQLITSESSAEGKRRAREYGHWLAFGDQQ